MALRTMLLAFCVVATPVVAQEAPKAAEPAKERKICRRVMPTGSTIPKSVCRTKGEWEAIGQQGQRDAGTIRDRPLSAPEVPRG